VRIYEDHFTVTGLLLLVAATGSMNIVGPALIGVPIGILAIGDFTASSDSGFSDGAQYLPRVWETRRAGSPSRKAVPNWMRLFRRFTRAGVAWRGASSGQ
jgi:hypothetical protein